MQGSPKTKEAWAWEHTGSQSAKEARATIRSLSDLCNGNQEEVSRGARYERNG